MTMRFQERSALTAEAAEAVVAVEATERASEVRFWNYQHTMSTWMKKRPRPNQIHVEANVLKTEDIRVARGASLVVRTTTISIWTKADRHRVLEEEKRKSALEIDLGDEIDEEKYLIQNVLAKIGPRAVVGHGAEVDRETRT
jgi:hypothetical protein